MAEIEHVKRRKEGGFFHPDLKNLFRAFQPADIDTRAKAFQVRVHAFAAKAPELTDKQIVLEAKKLAALH
ncbi:MAG: hypothetical protein GOV15_04835, partial [Candidatus Diapherotrites archaeon]|nr:hypothetical protein [Candidatus Diapherotrites archaeon]